MEWCDSTSPLLNRLFNDNDGSQYQARKILLISKLNDGIQKLSTARDEMSYNNLNLNRVAGAIITVANLIRSDFDNKTIEFQKENYEQYQNLENKVEHLYSKLNEFKSKMRNEIGHIYDLRGPIESCKTFLILDDIPDIRVDLHSSIKSLDSECIRYRNEHGGTSNDR